MIHPSYVELMDVVNKKGKVAEPEKTGEAPVINSRYSIVAATSKRARQIIDGSNPMVDANHKDKPLSVAISELYNGELRILTSEEAAQKDIELLERRQRQSDLHAQELANNDQQ